MASPRTMNILRDLIRENGKSISSNPTCSGEQRETFLFKGKLYAYVLEGMMEL